MTRTRLARRGGWFAAAILILSGFAPARAERIWFTGATIHPVGTEAIAGGVMAVADGTIVALGSGLATPAGETVIDLTGKHVYPGFVHPGSPIGLVEINSVRGTVDTTEIGEVNSHLRTEVAFNADSYLLAPAITGGVLTAHVVASGGVVAPASAVMRLDGWNWREMTLRSRAALHVEFPEVTLADEDPEPKKKEEFEKKKRAALRELDRIFDDARAWHAARRAEKPNDSTRVDADAALEALGPVLDGTAPLFLHARERRQIVEALDWAGRQKLTRLVLVSGADAVDVAERLAKAAIPVLLDGVLDTPSRPTDPYDGPYAAAGRLHAAGVRVAIGDGGDASNARNLPFHAAMAAAFGLPQAEALRAITLTPAELLGVADRVGSLAIGKDATFFVSDGDPLEIESAIERAWIRGNEFDFERDRQRQLWHRYANRPALK